MRDRLRIVFVEHPHLERGVVAQLLADCHIAHSQQRVASSVELGKVAAEFNPHIVFCTDETNSSARFIEALRLLCSQTPDILVANVCELDLAGANSANERSDDADLYLPDAQDPACLRLGFSGVLESSAAPAVIANADGWITHANTSACCLLAATSERALASLLKEGGDECSPMPHWLSPPQEAAPADHDRHCAVGTDSSPRRLAYIDSWSLIPLLVHMDDLIACATGGCDAGPALALIAVDRSSGRIPDTTCNPASQEEPAEADPGVPSDAVRHGSIVRITPDDFLVVLADPSRAEDAATTVQGVLDSIERHHRHRPRNDTPGSLAWECGQLREPGRLVAELDEAMQRQALSVHFQPQFDLKTGRGSGVEALARWVLPSGETIAPSVFIPAAERAGKIHALGAWMLKSACETAYAWCGREAQRTTLSVNVSPRQLDDEFIAVIGRALEKSRFPAKQLEMEITESALLANPDRTIHHLKQWKEIGIRVAIDNFGTDYSSLCHLPRLPVDRLKLDQSLIHKMSHDRKSAATARLIVSMGTDLGIDVIAEGVETEQQLQLLADLDCPGAQGYLLGRPMPARQAQVALRKPWGDRPARNLHPANAAMAESIA